jgi:hypothetical protein
VSGVGFLLIVVVISVVGSIIVWLRNRQPTNPLSSVDEFEREMQALGTTPPAVTDGQFRPQPRRPMNTVNVRPQDGSTAQSAEDAGGVDSGDVHTDPGSGMHGGQR